MWFTPEEALAVVQSAFAHRWLKFPPTSRVLPFTARAKTVLLTPLPNADQMPPLKAATKFTPLGATKLEQSALAQSWVKSPPA
jgi:hypothetical protein